MYAANRIIEANPKFNKIDGNPNFKETVRLLLDAGIDVNAKDDSGDTALMYLPSNNTLSTLPYKTLLDAGADVKITNEDGDTVVTKLLRRIENKDILKILLDGGAPVNAQTNAGHTALMIAATKSGRFFSDIVELLIEAGADPNIRSKDGQTALDYAERGNKDSYDLIKSAMSDNVQE
jgi:ankyrin repeat protein